MHARGGKKGKKEEKGNKKKERVHWRAGEVLRDAMAMQRRGREALTCECDEFYTWREKREIRWGSALLVLVVRSACGGRRGDDPRA
ncbi:hypothetical protein MRB53_009999 [Persea americana]|uniref:Uncharacterized protein n=1 Tax=Persea americana TaxID=3435 RepID=A0ACC2LRL5_PERAE|nr:hypothetical protein MRB53_009999 [Persea americana]